MSLDDHQPEDVLPQELCALFGMPSEPTPRLLPGQPGHKWPDEIQIDLMLFSSSETSRLFLVMYSLDLLRMLRRQRQSVTSVLKTDVNAYPWICIRTVKRFYRRFQVLVAYFWPEFRTMIEQTAGTSWGTAENDARLTMLEEAIDALFELKDQVLTSLKRHSKDISTEEFQSNSLLVIAHMEAIVESMVEQALLLRVSKGRQVVCMPDGTPILDLVRQKDARH